MSTKYYVVKYLNRKYGDRYAFVPGSWVEARRDSDNIIVIHYPTEDALAAEKRIKRKETPGADWNQRLCKLLYTTNDYNKAKIDTMMKNEAVKNGDHYNDGQTGSTMKNKDNYNDAKTDSTKNKGVYTRHTLLHPQPGRGLVELVEHSDVYVEKDKLETYTTAAVNSRILIRSLLTLVFTDFALSSCELTRKSNKLDGGALDALFCYVDSVSRQRGWFDVDDDYFNECVRDKLAEVITL